MTEGSVDWLQMGADDNIVMAGHKSLVYPVMDGDIRGRGH